MRLGQEIERALDVGDHAGGNAGIARRRIELVVTEQRLNDADINAALQEVGGKAVAQRMQGHGLGDPGGAGGLMEQAVELAGGDRSPPPAPREQPPLGRRHACVIAPRAKLPPLPQEVEQILRQHDVAVLAPLGLDDADDVLGAVDVADPEPDHLAGTQAAAIGEREQHANLEGLGDRKQALGLVCADHQRDLLGLANVVDLVGEIQPPERDAEQEPEPGHDAVAV